MVETYAAFREKLKKLGFFLFASGRGEMLELSDITRPESWHSDPPENDPWGWKDLVAASRDAAYVRVLDGRPTLISEAWIPRFIAAFEKEESLEERYEAGLVDSMTIRMSRLFAERPEWARHELSEKLGIGAKQKGAFDRALVALQKEMAVVINGQTQRVATNGSPIGWPSMSYCRLDAWAKPAWLAQAAAMDSLAAREEIRDRILVLSPACPPKALVRLCGIGAINR